MSWKEKLRSSFSEPATYSSANKRMQRACSTDTFLGTHSFQFGGKRNLDIKHRRQMKYISKTFLCQKRKGESNSPQSLAALRTGMGGWHLFSINSCISSSFIHYVFPSRVWLKFIWVPADSSHRIILPGCFDRFYRYTCSEITLWKERNRFPLRIGKNSDSMDFSYSFHRRDRKLPRWIVYK